MTRQHGRRDAIHRPILDALQRLGVGVCDCGDLGQGRPDAFVSYGSVVLAVEFKAEGEDLTPAERQWVQTQWHGPYLIARSLEDVLKALGIKAR